MAMAFQERLLPLSHIIVTALFFLQKPLAKINAVIV